MKSPLSFLAATLFLATPVLAEVTVTNAWVRSTVAGQGSTGAFMTLRSSDDARLVAVRSTAADIVEIHEMKMEGTVMKMGQIHSIALPAGKDVELKPGGYHVMLIELKKPIAEGEKVPFTLLIEESGTGKRKTMEITVPAKPLTGGRNPK